MKTKLILSLSIALWATTSPTFAATDDKTDQTQLDNPVLVDDVAHFDANDPQLNDEDREELNKERDYYFMTSTGFILPPTVNPHHDIMKYNSVYKDQFDNIQPSDTLIDDNTSSTQVDDDNTTKQSDDINDDSDQPLVEINDAMSINSSSQKEDIKDATQQNNNAVTNNQGMTASSPATSNAVITELPDTGEENLNTIIFALFMSIIGGMLIKKSKKITD